jgi:uncharacterized membrane protein YdbT with pleckstrin-like domain|tara:strand:+ start:1064 stop:1618 length:555 start_codon:yes stop_codon:yes gene_type:complete
VTETAPDNKPLFRLRSVFHPAVVAYSYPIRIIGISCILLMLLPEMAKGMAWVTGVEGFLSYLMAISIVGLIGFAGPLFMTWLDYKAVAFTVYPNRIEFIQSFWIREQSRVLLHSVREIKPSANWLQKRYGIGNISLVVESRIGAKQMGTVLPNIRYPEKVAAKLSTVLEDHKRRQQEQQQQQRQ